MTIAAATARFAATPTIGARVGTIVRGVLARMKARHDCRRLMALDDRHFRDMATTRADVSREIAGL